MRISDWSSDVCSSDLGLSHSPSPQRSHAPSAAPVPIENRERNMRVSCGWVRAGGRRYGLPSREGSGRHHQPRAAAVRRSEEHTSELQSLMRISYAVFCLKKKKNKKHKRQDTIKP